MLTKTQELAGLASWIYAHPEEATPAGDLPTTIANQLETARLTAAGRDTGEGTKRPGPFKRTIASLSGASFERTLGNIDAAEVNLLRLAPEEYLRGQVPSLLAHVNRYLPADDPRRLGVEALTSGDRQELSVAARDTLIAAFHAANSQRRRELIRLRSFRNLIVGATLTLFALAIVVAILGGVNREWMPLCFLPEDEQKFVCPLKETPVLQPGSAEIDELVGMTATSSDIVVIEIVGLVAAALAGAVALRRMRGTSTPYGVPVAMTLLKLPAGALTAVLGLLFMRGGFVPGLTALDSSAQILAWAIIFGYAQQVFTRLVDNQGQNLLEDVAGHGPAGARDIKSR